MKHVEVEEVLGRAPQGRTEPFLCRCSDGDSYYVKGRSAGRAGLGAEVIAAQIGTQLGLPIPEPVIAMVPLELVHESATVGIPLDDLGPGPAFGSKVIQARELRFADLDSIEPDLKESVAVFDWWLQNEDRTLSAKGGNVNLLWAIRPPEGLVVIDHNLAFSAFNPAEFLETHVFGDSIRYVVGDLYRKASWDERFRTILANWDDMCAALPVEWRYVDPEQTVPSQLSLAAMHAILQRCLTDKFWVNP